MIISKPIIERRKEPVNKFDQTKYVVEMSKLPSKLPQYLQADE